MAKDFLLINVVFESGFRDCHIPGSVSVPLPDLERGSAKFDKDQEIIVYCGSYDCPMSKKAWHLLHDLGFTAVKAYEGGMREWYQLKYPVAGECKAEYLKPASKKPESSDEEVVAITAQELLEKLKQS